MFRYITLTVCFILIVSFTCLNLFGVKKANDSSSTRYESIELVLYKNVTYQSYDGNLPNRDHIMTRNVHVPKFMLELYENNKYCNYNDTVPEVVRSVIPKSADVIDGYFKQFDDYQDNHLLIFDVPNESDDEIFLRAELKILTLIDDDNSNFFKGMERLIKLSVYDETKQNYFFVDKIKLYNTNNNTWITFNLTETVQDILLKKSNKTLTHRLKVVISIKHYYVELIANKTCKLRLSLMPINENIEHDYPILLLSYDVISKENDKNDAKRIKRNIEEDYEEETNKIWDDDISKKEYIKRLKKSRNACKRKPLYVNFSEINYDAWIVQPRGYEAYQCQGKCFYPVAEHLSPTKHAIVQALIHSVSPSKASRSCCVPTKLNSISVLYIDDNGVLTYRLAYQDMVVIECGCR